MNSEPIQTYVQCRLKYVAKQTNKKGYTTKFGNDHLMTFLETSLCAVFPAPNPAVWLTQRATQPLVT